MGNRIIRSKKGLELRKVGKQYMIVEAHENNVNMSDVYCLNQTAARMWERINQSECTSDDLIDFLCDDFDEDKAIVKYDVERQLAEWKVFGLIL